MPSGNLAGHLNGFEQETTGSLTMVAKMLSSAPQNLVYVIEPRLPFSLPLGMIR
jgi:hypothetical protein